MADEEEYEVVVEKKVRPIRKVKVSECDMSKELTAEVVELAQQALDEVMDTATNHKDVAQRFKHRLDKAKGGTWHVIIGTHFGGNVTNDASTLMNFQIDNVWYLVFRSGPPEKQGGSV